MSDIRTEFGFERTECACEECIQFCVSLPGSLIPADLEAICPLIIKVSNLTIKFQTQASKGSQDQPGPEHNPTISSSVIRKSSLHKYY